MLLGMPMIQCCGSSCLIQYASRHALIDHGNVEIGCLLDLQRCVYSGICWCTAASTRTKMWVNIFAFSIQQLEAVDSQVETTILI